MSAKSSSSSYAIDGQLTPNNVLNNALLAVFESVDRSLFVPAAYDQCAYVDQPIPLGHGRQMLAPLTQAYLLEHAQPEAGLKVLYIGGSKGYGAAVLAQMVKSVDMVEELTDCAEHARRYFSSNRKLAVDVFTGSLAAGHAENAPYDRIVIEGAIDFLPDALLEQLSDDGRCVAIKRVSNVPACQADLGRVAVYTKREGKLVERWYQEVFAPVLPGFETHQEFSL